MSAENPCPICGTPMHPAMESRYGHCGAPYCQGYHDALWNRVVPPDDHRAAMWGCTGTGEEAARCVPFAVWLRQMGFPHYDLSAEGCTAGEALARGEARHG